MAAGDVMLDASGNVMLDASGNVMLDDGSGNSCCCGGCTCATLASTACPTCTIGTTGCTPRYALLVFSGVATFCALGPGFNYGDANGATVAYAATVDWQGFTPGSPTSQCTWQAVDPAGASSYRVREFFAPTSTTGATCGGTPNVDHEDVYTTAIITQTSTGSGTVRYLVIISGNSGSYQPFYARVLYTGNCSGSVVVNNGQDDAHDPSTFDPFWIGGSGGTCTVTWCP